ncbi:MAG TPA: hypothetical protein VJ933_00875 [Phaeodactylibacter sp.]|nr:hypothetical protein [Phaeodactylibacter sp.]
MRRCLTLLALSLAAVACHNSDELEQLNHSFELGYQALITPVQERAQPVQLSRWDSLLKTYRLQLEQTTPYGDQAMQHWQNLQHRLLVFEEQIQAYRQQPALYNLGGQCQLVLSQSERPLEERLRRIHAQLQKAAPYYRSARRNLQQFDAEAARLGIKKQEMGQRLLKGALMDSLQIAGLPADTTQAVRQAARKAARVMRQYQSYLARQE